tara:strand:+ start:136 stop:423 length:288 start_codon:yes stop_codon:yes gene_type:complete
LFTLAQSCYVGLEFQGVFIVNSWEREYAETGGIKRWWGFLSIPHAIRECVTAENRIDYLNDTLSGCDWCCGGGDDEVYFLTSVIKLATAYIKENK